MKNIGAIEACREVIDHAPLLPYYEKQFRENALVRSVHFGTHIEGNELTLNQAEKVIEGGDIIARDRDIQEVLNYRKVMEFIGEFKVQSEKFKVRGVLFGRRAIGTAQTYRSYRANMRRIKRATQGVWKGICGIRGGIKSSKFKVQSCWKGLGG